MEPIPAAQCQRTALFLDVDGTLLELARTPDTVVVTDALRALLAALEHALGGALALVSGRRIDDLDRVFTPLALPAAGIHGLERRAADGSRRAPPESSWRADIAARLETFAARHPGLRLEDKGHALALHYRAAPALGAEAGAFCETLVQRAHSPLRLLRGKRVFEFIPDGYDKGSAITEFMHELPFTGRHPVFIGDDVTDEAGFAAVNRLGGRSIRVGTTNGSCAFESLPDVAAVHAWLQATINGPGDGARA